MPSASVVETAAVASLIAIVIEAAKAEGLKSKHAPLLNLGLSLVASLVLSIVYGRPPAEFIAQAVAIAGAGALGYDAVQQINADKKG